MIDWETRWRRTWALLGLQAPGGAVLDGLLARYREPQRHYHTLQHLEECFTALDTLIDLACQPGAVELALWWHDAVYDPRQRDNEALSAALAANCLHAAGAEAALVDRVAAMILATRSHDTAGDPDCAIMLDADLAILSAPWPRFVEYDAQIRAEYAHVPLFDYQVGRARVLRSFLDRPCIYASARFACAHEAQARANLARSLDAL
jgi:predicted metal-dependent HD superfamily phosphohydrolase